MFYLQSQIEIILSVSLPVINQEMEKILGSPEQKRTTKILNLHQLKRLLFSSQAMAPLLIHFILIMEIGALFVLTNLHISDFLKTNISSISFEFAILSKSCMTVQALVIILLQLRFRVSFFRLGYLRYFYKLDFQDPIDYILVLLTAIALFIDFVKTANCLLTFRNQWSQKYNCLKLFSYAVNIAAVLATRYRNIVMVGVVGFLGLINYLLRVKYRMVNRQTQALLEMMSLAGLALSVCNIIILISLQPVKFYWQPIIFFALTMIHILLKQYLLKPRICKELLEIERILKDGDFLETIRSLYSQLHCFNFKFLSSCNLKNFLQSTSGEQLPELNDESRPKYLKLIYNLAVNYEELFRYNMMYWVMRGELEIEINKNIFGFVKVIEELELQIKNSRHGWISHIMMVRLKELQRNLIGNLNQGNKKDQAHENMLQGFIKNSYLIDAVTHATQAYYCFYEGLVNGFVYVSNLNDALDQLIVRTSDVSKSYQKIGSHKSRTSIEIYLFYLKLVSNQLDQIRNLRIDLECLKSSALDVFPYHTSMYLSLNLSGTILKVGENCIGLLDYERKQIERCSISRLIPKFCEVEHDKWFDGLIQNAVKSRGVQSLVRFGKETFCVNSSNNLKLVRLDLFLHLSGEQVVFSGSMKVESQKHIVSFKGSGEILLTGDYHGQCETRYIFEENNPNVEQIIDQLVADKAVKLTILVNDNLITDQYVLFKVIAKEDPEETVYVIRAFESSCNQRSVTLRKPSEVKGSPQKPLKYFAELQRTKAEYLEGSTRIRTFGKIGFILAIMVFVILYTLDILNTSHNRNQSKREVVNYLSTFETTSLGIVNMIVRTFHIDYSVREGIYYPAFDQVQIGDLLEFIRFSHISFEYIADLPQLMVRQYFQHEEFDAVSYQVIQTIVTNFDWMLMDIIHYPTQNRFIELTSYTAQNCETFLFYLFPFYEQKILEKAFRNAVVYRNKFLVQITVVPVVIFIQFVLILICNCRFQRESMNISESVLGLENEDLAPFLQRIGAFRNILENKKGSLCSSSSFRGEDPSRNSINSPQKALHQVSVVESSPSGDNSKGRGHSRFNSSSNSMMDFISANNSSLVPKSLLQPDEVEYETVKKPKIRQAQPLKRNYPMYIVFTTVTLLIMINFGLYFKLTSERWYSLKPYVTSAIALKSTFYSYQIMFTLMLLNFNQNNTKLNVFKQTIDNFTFATQQLSKYQSDLFNLPGFEEFRDLKQKLDYDPICSYMQCRMYEKQFNSTYYGSIEYSYSKIVNVYQALESRNVSYREVFEGDYDMDYLVYADQLYMEIISKILDTFFKAMLTHINNNEAEARIRILVHLILVILLTAICLRELVGMIRVRRWTLQVLSLFKENSECQSDEHHLTKLH